MAPRFSVLLPTHNRADVVGLAVRSVLAQTEPDFELLVAGDGCTDDTADVVASFGDGRIRWLDFPKAPGFGYANRNRALRQARGELIAIVAHDDLLLADHLELMGSAFDSRRVEWAYSRPFWMTDDGIGVPFAVDLRHPAAFLGFMQNMNPLPASCVVHRHSCLDRYSYWPEEILQWGDWHLWKRMIGPSGGTNLEYVPVPTSIHFRANWRPPNDWVMPALESWMREARTHWWPASLTLRVPAGVVPQQAVWELLSSDPRGWAARIRAGVVTVVDGYAWDASAARQRCLGLDAELADRGSQVRALQASLAVETEQRRALDEALATLEQSHAEQASRLLDQTQLANALLTSRSWRLMAPARRAASTIRRWVAPRGKRA